MKLRLESLSLGNTSKSIGLGWFQTFRKLFNFYVFECSCILGFKFVEGSRTYSRWCKFFRRCRLEFHFFFLFYLFFGFERVLNVTSRIHVPICLGKVRVKASLMLNSLTNSIRAPKKYCLPHVVTEPPPKGWHYHLICNLQFTIWFIL